MKTIMARSVPSLRWLPRQAMAGQRAYERIPDHLMVIESRAIHPNDGREWLHVSYSHSNRLPTWDDLKEVRATFVPDNRTAIQVFPPQSQWVNIHPYCLHLWCCLDEDVVPAFAVDGSI